MTRGRVQELLYGNDATERIVAVEYARNGQVEIIRRDLDGAVRSDMAPFQPWFITTDHGVHAARSATVEPLSGDLPLNRRLIFSSWSTLPG